MTNPYPGPVLAALCACGDSPEPNDPDGLCWFCRFWNGANAHGPFTLLTLEEASRELTTPTE